MTDDTDLQGSLRSDDRDGPKGDTQPPDPVAEAVARTLAEHAASEPAAPPKRGRGRPRGSKTRRRDGSAVAQPESATPQPEPTEEELAWLGEALGTVWEMAGARLRRRPLTPEESAKLARVAHPVLAKYGGGFLDQWGPEIALGFTLVGLWKATELPPEPKTEDNQVEAAA